MLVPISAALLLASQAQGLTIPNNFESKEPRIKRNARFVTRQNNACTNGLHMIVARASAEPQGEGATAAVADKVAAAVPDSNSEALLYPATLSNYADSVTTGVVAMQARIRSYTAACPESKIALLGFSQGAQVIGDALGGGGASEAQALSPAVTKNVVAIALFGDPTHVAGKSYNAGSGDNSGTFARANTAVLDTYADRMISFCDAGDTFCDSGSSLQTHLATVSNNDDAAADWVVSKFTAKANVAARLVNRTPGTPTSSTKLLVARGPPGRGKNKAGKGKAPDCPPGPPPPGPPPPGPPPPAPPAPLPPPPPAPPAVPAPPPPAIPAPPPPPPAPAPPVPPPAIPAPPAPPAPPVPPPAVPAPPPPAPPAVPAPPPPPPAIPAPPAPVPPPAPPAPPAPVPPPPAPAPGKPHPPAIPPPAMPPAVPAPGKPVAPPAGWW